MKITDVAVGVLVKPNGTVLYAQRLEGKPYAGWWEFPGGKQEAGETIAQALKRELFEELGITVTKARQWVVRDHVYPHATVQLHFFKVTEWLGEPASAEGQALRWLDATDRSSLSPMLPAALPVIEWLTLPEQITINSSIDQCALGQIIELTGQGTTPLKGLVGNCAEQLAQAPQMGLDFFVLLAPELSLAEQTKLAVQSRLPVYSETLLEGSQGCYILDDQRAS